MSRGSTSKPSNSTFASSCKLSPCTRSVIPSRLGNGWTSSTAVMTGPGWRATGDGNTGVSPLAASRAIFPSGSSINPNCTKKARFVAAFFESPVLIASRIKFDCDFVRSSFRLLWPCTHVVMTLPINPMSAARIPREMGLLNQTCPDCFVLRSSSRSRSWSSDSLIPNSRC